MSQYLNYLEKYEEKGNDVIFYLKEYPSSKIAGNKITRELYISLFHDESLQLNRVHKIDEYTYLIQKEQEFYCLNCNTPIYFEEDYYSYGIVKFSGIYNNISGYSNYWKSCFTIGIQID